jgi:hypothetical protein
MLSQSAYFALVIGFYLFFVSLAMLVHPARFKKIIAAMLGDQALLTLSGVLAIVFGLFIVIVHNVWCTKWPIVVTLFGWVILIQGLARIFAPDHFVKIAKVFQDKIGYAVISWFWLLVGAYLIWAGLF